MTTIVRAISSLILVAFLALPLHAADIERLFRERRWDELDKVFAAASPDMSARELSLAANAFWIRGNREEALECMDRAKKGMPQEIVPYADMIRILALERTGRTADAKAEATRLLSSKCPKDLAYFAAYALYRLAAADEVAPKRTLLRKMYALSDGKAQKMQVLSELVSLPDVKDPARRAETSNACRELLLLHPTNAKALAILSESPKPWSADISFVVGYAAYLRRDYAKAAALLRAVPISSREGRMARYYRGYSLMRLGRGGEALDVFSPLALSGKSYADSAVRRIAQISKGSLEERGVALLRKVAATRRGDMAARAMEALSRLLAGTEARRMEDRVVREYPDSELAADILWKRGWKRWDEGSVADAVAVWKKLLTPGVGASWAPRILYWVGRGYERLGKKDRAAEYFNRLGRSYPLSIHAFLAFPNGVKPIVDGDPKILESAPGELERWGFVVYAKRQLLERGTPKDLYRAALLSQWNGDGQGAYAAASRISRLLVGGDAIYRTGLRFLYPQAFADIVRPAAARFATDENVVWAIMRQESAYDPLARSWVGATGLMQLMPATARGEAKALDVTIESLYDVGTNVLLGTAHIARLLRNFKRVEWAAAAYNAGSGAAKRWIAGNESMPLDRWMEEVGYRETNGYVRRVMANLYVYRMLYPKEPAKAEQGKKSGTSLSLVSDDQLVEDEGAAGDDDDTPPLNVSE